MKRSRGYALAYQLIAETWTPMFLRVTDLAPPTWLGLELESRTRMLTGDGARGPRGREVGWVHPGPIGFQRRLLQCYSESPGMVGGATESHRLDGLTMSEAKRLRESGGMNADQYYCCIFES